MTEKEIEELAWGAWQEYSNNDYGVMANIYLRSMFVKGFKKAQELKGMEQFKPITDGVPSEGCHLLGFSKEWINEDFNPDGIRECFPADSSESGWISAKWNDYMEQYDADEKSAPTHWKPITSK